MFSLRLEINTYNKSDDFFSVLLKSGDIKKLYLWTDGWKDPKQILQIRNLFLVLEVNS